MIDFGANIGNMNLTFGYLKTKLGNKYAVYAMMGTFQAVSGFSSYYGWERYKGYLSTDELCFMKDFVHDKKPFGILGWKKWTRKQSLFNLARRAKKGIYDLYSQLAFVMDDINCLAYQPLLEELKETKGVEEACQIIFDREFVDIPKKERKKTLEKTIEFAKEIEEYYEKRAENFKVPKKYVQTDLNRVVVRGPKGKKFPFLRKKFGYLAKGELYPFIVMDDACNEFAILYHGEVGYVKASKAYTITKMEED